MNELTESDKLAEKLPAKGRITDPEEYAKIHNVSVEEAKRIIHVGDQMREFAKKMKPDGKNIESVTFQRREHGVPVGESVEVKA